MSRTIRIAALTLVLAALAVLPAGTELRAHSPGSATLTALGLETDSGGGLHLSPTFSSTVYAYTVRVANRRGPSDHHGHAGRRRHRDLSVHRRRHRGPTAIR